MVYFFLMHVGYIMSWIDSCLDDADPNYCLLKIHEFSCHESFITRGQLRKFNLRSIDDIGLY